MLNLAIPHWYLLLLRPICVATYDRHCVQHLFYQQLEINTCDNVKSGNATVTVFVLDLGGVKRQ